MNAAELPPVPSAEDWNIDTPSDHIFDSTSLNEGYGFESIPDHLLVDLMSDFLDGSIRDSCRVSQVCQNWNQALTDTSYWEHRLVADFGMDSDLYHPSFRQRCDSSSTDTSDFHPKDIYGATHTLEQRFTSGNFVSKSRRYLGCAITSVMMVDDEILVGDSNGSVHVYDSQSQTVGSSLERLAFRSPVTALTRYGTMRCSGHSSGTVSIWKNPENRMFMQVHEIDSRVSGMTADDSNLLTASTVDGTIRATDLQTGTVVFTKHFPQDGVPNTITALDHNIFFAGCRNSRAIVVDARTDGSSNYLTVPLNDWCLCVESSTDPTMVRASDKAVHLFDLRRSVDPVESRHASDRLVSRFKSDSSLRLVSCGLDGNVRISSLKADEVTCIHSSEDYILSLDFTRTALCCGGMNGKLELYDFHT